MNIVMDADCLIKLTKAKLKELVCKNFKVVIPQVVKEEVVDHALAYPDAMVIQENLEKNLLTISKGPVSLKKREEAVLKIYQRGKFDAIGSDDKRFIKKLQLLNIPYIPPAVFIVLLVKRRQIALKVAQIFLDALGPLISDGEYYTVQWILNDARRVS
ncbi:MAG: hypothetical protein HYS07_06410 [Chlamydiae bacterium]|nr:hypothetical protein [Chlamydiota bacterium]MBI3276554.1 hypothetical protein [Chlamydiota bacterium]